MINDKIESITSDEFQKLKERGEIWNKTWVFVYILHKTKKITHLINLFIYIYLMILLHILNLDIYI